MRVFILLDRCFSFLFFSFLSGVDLLHFFIVLGRIWNSFPITSFFSPLRHWSRTLRLEMIAFYFGNGFFIVGWFIFFGSCLLFPLRSDAWAAVSHLWLRIQASDRKRNFSFFPTLVDYVCPTFFIYDSVIGCNKKDVTIQLHSDGEEGSKEKLVKKELSSEVFYIFL